MQLRKVAVSTFLLGLGVYILLPTADEIIVHPTFGWFLSYVFNIPLALGILLSVAIYRGVGVACLLGALGLGGKPVYAKLKDRLRKRKKSEKQGRNTKQ